MLVEIFNKGTLLVYIFCIYYRKNKTRIDFLTYKFVINSKTYSHESLKSLLVLVKIYFILQILTNQQRQKPDETNDSEFYSTPKFVYHLDSNFRKNLSELYEEEFENNCSVLDLMSSWDSYLPRNLKYKKVIGHGLNKEELERNKALDDYWIQNFNINQKIPLENETIDYCLMVAAWQYLQYPEKITEEVARVLDQKGKFIIAFSNRAFWHKAPNIWTYSNETERIEYVRNILVANGFCEPRVIKKFIEANSFLPFFNRDPFYCLISEKN